MHVGLRPDPLTTSKRVCIWLPNEPAQESPTVEVLRSLGLSPVATATGELQRLRPSRDLLVVPSMWGLAGDWTTVAPQANEVVGPAIRRFLEAGGTVLCFLLPLFILPGYDFCLLPCLWRGNLTNNG